MIARGDVMNLTMGPDFGPNKIGMVTNPATPYGGRYPCANVYANGTWYYGTYLLSHAGTGAECANPNWPVQGPFVGFRTSTDKGMSWLDPWYDLTNKSLGPDPWSNNVFRESAAPNPSDPKSCHNNSKVKFGAPNAVDFGRELENSPDGKIYIVGHGSTDFKGYESWMSGDQLYLARVEPRIDTVNTGAAWEFWSGKQQGWTKGNVNQAAPLFTWPNRTGSVTMTYVPAIKRYIICVCTIHRNATVHSVSTATPFDTYILESESMTGPFSLITYMPRFGIQAYFVAMPSEWIADSVNASDGGSLEGFINYSADWAFHSDKGNPRHLPANWGNWLVQHVKLSRAKAGK